MAWKEGERKCFTFIWKLENIRYCVQKKGELIISPPFEVGEIEGTIWTLGLYPRGKEVGNYIGFFLYRDINSKGEIDPEIQYELHFVANDGSVLKSFDVTKYAIPKGTGYGLDKFVKREDVFLTKRSEFLPQNTLTVRCKIWKCTRELLQDVCCSARTRIGAEKRSFLWKIENFSALEIDKKYSYLLKSFVNNKQLITLDLSVTGGLSCEEIIRFQFVLQDQSIKFSALCLHLVDAYGNKVQCNQDEFWFDTQNKYKQFSFLFTRQQLKAKKSVYLPDDVLSLHWDWTFSKGIVLEEIEEVQQGCTRTENEISDAGNVNNEIKIPFSDNFNDNLKSLYDASFLCDVKLKTSTNVYPAHKVVLSASSSVFKAMFSNDMKEKFSSCVDINDFSDDTINRMLLFIYNTRVEDLTWETASQLYVAADKYAILGLKNICSSYLKDNLSLNNACEALLLSDLYTDGDLKSVVQGYILGHIQNIVNTAKWKILMETNAKLAAETLCLQYK
ncbi:TD and POZ domain-containing protein 5 [Argiope bruennichi]|uniref:TD and POZ domain-containing protein 5 n=1 Tax=Argiope bruennichi TaxID=94029 RepID=A0A8T0EH99_ARGBR|nr:TD and POZ domain-containing protein 5 [Argiope bruennichi]